MQNLRLMGVDSAIASSSLLTEWVKGKTLDEASVIKNTQIANELSITSCKNSLFST